MANVKFSRKEFEKHVKINAEIEDRINMMGTPLEGLDDKEIEIEIFPNRPDLLSMQGYVRALKAFVGKDVGLKKYSIRKSGEKLKVDKSLPSEWPYAYAFIVRGLKLDDEKIKDIIQVQEKLGGTMLRRRKKGGIGLYPLEKIEFPVNFVGRSPEEIKFLPLEAKREMTAPQILKGHPTGRTYANIMDGWKKYPVFIDHSGKIMSMPPIINSHDVGKIDEGTKDVFVEATGTDPEVLKKSLAIIATTLADIGGKIYSIECEQQDGTKEIVPDLSAGKMKVSLERTNKLLGLDLKEKDLEKLLPKMGYDYSKGKVSVPAWRTDILHEVDIIEDVAIAYSYDKLVPEISNAVATEFGKPRTPQNSASQQEFRGVSTTGKESKKSKLRGKIAEALSGLGILEISSFHLVKANEVGDEAVELEDSKTEYKFLRPNLFAPAMRILSENKDNEYPQKIFEIGKVFNLDRGYESGIREDENLCVALTPGGFTDAKQVLDYLFKVFELEYSLEDGSRDGLIDGRVGIVKFNGREIGYVGEVHPSELKAWGIRMPVVFIELKLKEIFKELD